MKRGQQLKSLQQPVHREPGWLASGSKKLGGHRQGVASAQSPDPSERTLRPCTLLAMVRPFLTQQAGGKLGRQAECRTVVLAGHHVLSEKRVCAAIVLQALACLVLPLVAYQLSYAVARAPNHDSRALSAAQPATSEAAPAAASAAPPTAPLTLPAASATASCTQQGGASLPLASQSAPRSCARLCMHV